MHVYSLGMTLYWGADYKIPLNQVSAIKSGAFYDSFEERFQTQLKLMINICWKPNFLVFNQFIHLKRFVFVLLIGIFTPVIIVDRK